MEVTILDWVEAAIVVTLIELLAINRGEYTKNYRGVKKHEAPQGKGSLAKAGERPRSNE